MRVSRNRPCKKGVEEVHGTLLHKDKTTEIRQSVKSPIQCDNHQGQNTAAAGASLKPKEHGAYAILLIPMLTSFLGWGITTSGTCVALAAFAGFMAHEPLLVMIGNRGARAQRNAPSAWVRCSLLVVASLLLGSFALWSRRMSQQNWD